MARRNLYDLLILFPGALGDFLCLWPTLQALRARTRGRVVVAAKPAFSPLLDAERFESISIDRREVADLFASDALGGSTRALLGDFARVLSWTGYGDGQFAQRLEVAAGVAPQIHPFRGMRSGEHAVEYYARCAGVAPRPDPMPISAEATVWAREFWAVNRLRRRTLVVHPGSGSRRKNWEGIAAVAEWWRTQADADVVFISGPAEAEQGRVIPAVATIDNESLDRVAAVLQLGHRYLGNDSGISHLAGLVGGTGVTVFGSTDPALWRPWCGALRVLHAPQTCEACGAERFCTHRLTVGAVCEALGRMR